MRKGKPERWIEDMTTKRVNPAILPTFKDALVHAFWYKSDLRSFLDSCMQDRTLVARLDWGASSFKRNIVSSLVDALAAEQHKYFDDLLNLILATAALGPPEHLRRVDDGEAKFKEAVRCIALLKEQARPLSKFRTEQEGFCSTQSRRGSSSFSASSK
jgi:hypothetical protein